MKKTFPKKAYGYYCDLCGEFGCKYVAEYYGNFICVRVGELLKEKDVCYDCAKKISKGVSDEFQ